MTNSLFRFGRRAAGKGGSLLFRNDMRPNLRALPASGFGRISPEPESGLKGNDLASARWRRTGGRSGWKRTRRWEVNIDRAFGAAALRAAAHFSRLYTFVHSGIAAGAYAMVRAAKAASNGRRRRDQAWQ